MKTSLHLILRSWQLPWQEKQLLALPVLFFLLIIPLVIFGNGLGLQQYQYDIVQTNPGTPPSELEFEVVTKESFLYQVYRGLTVGFLAYFFAGAAVAIVLRALDARYLILESGYAAAKQRIGTWILLAFVYTIVDIASDYLFIGVLQIVLIVVAYFLFMYYVLLIPTIVVEGGEYWYSRCLYLCRKVLGTLFLSSIALVISLALPCIALLLLYVISEMTLLVVLLLVAYLWLAFPVVWSYQALLYQHAVDRESADALPSNP